MQERPRRSVTRRTFVRVGVLTLASGALTGLATACAPIQPPAPTAAPAPTPPAAQKPAEAKPTQAAPAQASGQQVSGQPTAPAATRPAEQPAAPAAKPASPPKRGGTLRIAQVNDVEPKRIHSITFVNYQLLYQVYDTLTRYDQSLKPQPELAESWSWSSDNKTLTFKLRQGVTFHTGRPMDSEDVKFNILRVKEERVASQMRPFANDVQDIQTPDKSTIVLQFNAPRPAIFDMFESLAIMDRETIADAEEAKRLVGTGPFKWDQWTPGDRLTLTRNDNFWKAGQPYLDKIVLQIMPDTSSALVNLEAGSVDVVAGPSETDIARLLNDSRFGVLVSEAGAQYYSFGANVTNAPLDNKKVRQAINYGIDRKRFVDTVLAGVGEPTSIPWPKHSPAYSQEFADYYRFDLNKARQLLQEAGVDTVDVTLISNAGNKNLAKAAQIAQADLAKVNVRIKIEEQEPAAFQQVFTGRKIQQMWANIFGFNNMYPTTMMVQAFPWRVSGNVSYFESADYSRLVAAGQVATDPAEQKRIFADLAKLVLDESFMYPLSPQKNAWAHAASVHGMEYVTFGMLSLRGAGFA